MDCDMMSCNLFLDPDKKKILNSIISCDRVKHVLSWNRYILSSMSCYYGLLYSDTSFELYRSSIYNELANNGIPTYLPYAKAKFDKCIDKELLVRLLEFKCIATLQDDSDIDESESAEKDIKELICNSTAIVSIETDINHILYTIYNSSIISGFIECNINTYICDIYTEYQHSTCINLEDSRILELLQILSIPFDT